MSTSDTGSDWGRPWAACEVARLRMHAGLRRAAFGRQLGVHPRTVTRWEEGDTAAADEEVIAALDDLLVELTSKLALWIPVYLFRTMHRRDVLRFLATGGALPWSGSDQILSVPIGDSTLAHLNAVTTALASSFKTVPSAVLLGPVTAHLENACRLLRASMRQGHQRKLHAIIADVAAFAGRLSFNGHKPGQASALYGLAQEHARQAGNPALLAEVLVGSSKLHSATPHGERLRSKDALDLLEEADRLAARYAAPIVRARITARLTEERAAGNDASGSDEAFERAQRALAEAQTDGFTGSGFHSLTGVYAECHESYLDGFRGISDVLLGRNGIAVGSLSVALAGASAPTRRRACILTDLGDALAGDGHPEEGARRLVEAHTICVDHDYAMGLQRIRGVRARFEPSCASLPAVHELDELLQQK
ncbi:MAG: helix-turn-helix domain-containing protein [Egibacteraceae bacterium]